MIRKTRGSHQVKFVELSEELLEFTDGHLLGDGSLVYSSKRSISPRFTFSSKYHLYLGFLKKQLLALGIQSCPIWSRVRKERRSPVDYILNSWSYYNLSELHKRWYPNGKKKIPNDLHLSPKVMLWWYIDDGCLTRSASTDQIFLCTHTFSDEELFSLRRKLIALGITTSKHADGRLYIWTESHGRFFDYLGECPKELTSVYGYKWRTQNAYLHK